MASRSRVALVSIALALTVGGLLVGRSLRGWKITTFELDQKRCARGEGDACARVGSAYFQGTPEAPRDRARAFEYFGRGCTLKSGYACYQQGVALHYGWGTARNPRAAAKLYARACALGNPSGCRAKVNDELAQATSDKDRARVMGELADRCHRSDDVACNHAGEILVGGAMGVHADPAAARARFLEACTHKNPEGCRRLGQMLACASGGPRDLPRAESFLIAACRRHDADACRQLSTFIEQGVGMAQLGGREFHTEWIEAAISLAGDGDDQHRLARVLQHIRDDGDAAFPAFVEACAALDANAPDVKSRVDALRRLSPKQPQLAVLDGLVKQRASGQPWLESLVRAWVAAGRPNLDGTAWSPARLAYDEFRCTSLEAPSDLPALDGSFPHFAAYVAEVQRLGTADAMPDELVDEAIGFTTSPDVATRLLALEVLSLNRLTDRQRTAAEPAAKKTRASLGLASPKNLFFALAPLCARSRRARPFDASELDRLTAMRALPFRPPAAEVRAMFQRALTRVGRPHDAGRWFTADIDAIENVSSCLPSRASLSDAGARDRELGEDLIAIGRATGQTGWVFDAQLGVALEEYGAERTGVPADEERAAHDRDAVNALYSTRGFMPQIGDWPLHGLWREERERFAADGDLSTMRVVEALGAADGGAL